MPIRMASTKLKMVAPPKSIMAMSTNITVDEVLMERAMVDITE